MDNDKFLETLKAGDEVIVYHSTFGRGYRTIEQVTHVTKTQIVVGATRFRRHTGHEVGDGYRKSFLLEATPEVKAEVIAERQHALLVRKIETIRWRDLSLTVLREVDKVLASAVSGERDVTP